MRIGAVVAAVAVAGVLGGCGSGSGSGSGSGGSAAGAGPVQHPAQLVGDVGHHDAFVIKLTDGSGAPIRNLAAGTYRLTVDDESTIHDFHLRGAGVDEATQVGSTGTKTFTVTFTPGDYTFVCDPHAAQMKGSFHVS